MSRKGELFFTSCAINRILKRTLGSSFPFPLIDIFLRYLPFGFMFKTLISRYVMTHITKLPSQSMFNSEGSRFINKYNTTIEVIVYLSAINDLPLAVQRKSSEAIRTKTDLFARP